MGEDAGASLDTQAGLAPVTTLSVVPESCMSVPCSVVCAIARSSREVVESLPFPIFRISLSEEFGRYLPDGVASTQTNPLRDGAVLTLSFGKLLLGAEGLVALCGTRGLAGFREGDTQ